MKQFFFTAALTLGLYGAAEAAPAKLFASNLGNGIAPSNGLVGVSAATVRFGVFPEGFNFTGKSFAQLDAEFIQVAQSSTPLTTAGRRGFFDTALDYDTSALVDGQRIYVWILNGNSPETAPQQAIFSTAQRFVTPNGLFPNHSFVSPDTGALELVAHIGGLASGSNIGGSSNAHVTSGSSYRVTDADAYRTPAADVVFQGTPVTFTVIADSSFVPTYQWRRNGINISGATGSQLVISSAQPDQTGTYDCVVKDGASTVASNPVALNVYSTKPTFTLQPKAEVVALGSTVSLNALAIAPADVLYVWKKGTKPIASANEPQFEIAKATKDDAGAYSCNATNSAMASGTGTTSSLSAEVVVLDTREKYLGGASGSTVKMAAVYYGKPSGFRWKRNGSYISNNTKYAGATTKTLVVKNLGVADHGAVFSCEVTAGSVAGGYDSLEAGNINLSVFTGPPAFSTADTPILLPDATIGESYQPYQIPAVNSSVFTVTGLPKGMVCDPNTGIISGVPTARKTNPLDPFQLVISILNGRNKQTRSASLIVKTIAEGVEGSYTAVINRSVFSGGYSHTDNLGGRVDMTVSSLGSVSGAVTFGAAGKIAFKGYLNNPGSATPSGSILIRRPAISTVPLVFNFTIQTVGGNPYNRTLTGSFVDNSLVAGQPSVRSTSVGGWKMHADATPYSGNYNVALTTTGDSATRPVGASLLNLSIPADGSKVILVGTTSDGQKLVGSTFVGGSGQVLVFNPLYDQAKGSLLGNLQLNTGATAAEDTIGGGLSWMRPSSTSVVSRAYLTGFNIPALVIAGGRYVLTGDRVLNASADTVADLEFSDAGLSAADPADPARPDIRVQLGAANLYTVLSANPRLTKLKLDASKGLFSGTFTYPGVANKSVKFQGHIIRNGGAAGQWQGFGYFLLTQQPGGVTDPVQSGLVTLSVAP